MPLYMESALPPGQRRREDFPRFGMPAFAGYAPTDIVSALSIRGEVAHLVDLDPLTLKGLARVEQESDLHCVTTWSYGKIRWSGFLFADFWERIVLPRCTPDPGAKWVRLRGADGHRATLRLEDILAPDVILADQMDGEPLPLDHGAPLRLVAPAHYGYKSVKHLEGIEIRRSFKPGPALLEHPRARVAFEERGRRVPGPVLRSLYRPLIGYTIRALERP